jgi:hypothetical protein
MIMGNTEIALPTDKANSTTDKTIGIPVVSTKLESRSVLGDKNNRPPSVHRDEALKTDVEASTRDVAEANRSLLTKNDSLTKNGSIVNPSHVGNRSSTTRLKNNVATEKRSFSWAGVARNKR